MSTVTVGGSPGSTAVARAPCALPRPLAAAASRVSCIPGWKYVKLGRRCGVVAMRSRSWIRAGQGNVSPHGHLVGATAEQQIIYPQFAGFRHSPGRHLLPTHPVFERSLPLDHEHLVTALSHRFRGRRRRGHRQL
jgi:hypothetical protein